jgi:hypothetical protein
MRLAAFILNVQKKMLRGGAHDESTNEERIRVKTKWCDTRQKHSDFPWKNSFRFDLKDLNIRT